MSYAIQIGSYATVTDAQAMKDRLIHNELWIPDDLRNATIEDTTPVPPLSSWTEIYSTTVNDSYSSTSAGSLLNISGIPYDDALYLLVRVRDTAGKRPGYFFGSDAFIANYYDANGNTTDLTYIMRECYRCSTSNNILGYPTATNTGYGIYPERLRSSGVLNIYHRYNSSYSLTINGTYSIKVYKLDPPSGVSIF